MAKPAVWDPDFYNISTEERNLIQKRAERRRELKAEWMKKSTDPRQVGVIHVIGTPEEQVSGLPDTVRLIRNDPALARNYALKFTRIKEMNMTGMRMVYGVALALPIVCYSLYLSSVKNELERKIKSGELTAKERSKSFYM